MGGAGEEFSIIQPPTSQDGANQTITRGRETDFQFLKLHSRSRSLVGTRSRSHSPNPSSLALQQAVPHVPRTGGSNDLWTKAFHKLPDELKQHLGVNKPEAAAKLQTLQNVLQTAIQAQGADMANGRKLKWGDKEIGMQGVADRLVDWITKFKEIGDIAVQHDLVHAALPWAGVRFILLVRSTTYV